MSYHNPNFVTVTTEMGERYATAKMYISWAQPIASQRNVNLSKLRSIMDNLHRSWSGKTTYADSNFPDLLDQFEAEWKVVKSSLL